MSPSAELLEQVESLQNILVSHATGGHEEEADYSALRDVLLARTELTTLVPKFVEDQPQPKPVLAVH